jgi:squalene synthase HpnD
MTVAIAEPVEEGSGRVAGSTFYLAMRIMPPKQRQAIFEIYSFCRAVDDIADDGGPRDVQVARLQRWRADLDAIYAGAQRQRLSKLAEAIATFRLRREDFMAVIDGMEMDVLSTMAGPDWATLDLYCDRVASAVGRLCVRVFGFDEQPGVALAHHLGRALQLTNILRDIDEDAGVGRLYLPLEPLLAAGITTKVAEEAIAHPAIGEVCKAVVARAEHHFQQLGAIFAASPRAVVRTPRIMGESYRLILSRLVARGWEAPRAPVKLRRLSLVWIVLRCIVR